MTTTDIDAARRRKRPPRTLIEDAGHDADRQDAITAANRSAWRAQCRQDLRDANARRLDAIAEAEAAGRRMQEALAAAARAESAMHEAAKGLGTTLPTTFARGESARRISRHLAAILRPLGTRHDFGNIGWTGTAADPATPWKDGEAAAVRSLQPLLTEDQ